MFKTLSNGIAQIFNGIKKYGSLSKSQIEDTVNKLRMVLLDADVALPVVNHFIEQINISIASSTITKSIAPDKVITKIIYNEIVNILSYNNLALNVKLNVQSSIMLVGIQGNGKTSVAAKLAYRLKNQKYKVLLVSLDTYRPAAIDQLRILANMLNVEFFDVLDGENPIDITERVLKNIYNFKHYTIIYDTAGRAHIDTNMLNEVKHIQQLVKPTETILVVDSMIGQRAIDISNKFNNALNIDSFILSRIDSDANGGAALSVTFTTKKPIKFLSNGEKYTELVEFQPKIIANKILNITDTFSSVKEFTQLLQKHDIQQPQEINANKRFDLNDYLTHIRSIIKLGGLSKIFHLIPGVNKMLSKNSKIDEKALFVQIAIIESMTKKERCNPNILNASRKKRIAQGSGTSLSAINALIQHYQMVAGALKKIPNKNQ